MPDQPDTFAPVNARQFRELLKEAGLNVSEERAPLLLEELNTQRGYARLFPPVAADANESEAEPWDPAFPKFDQGESAQ